MSGFTPEVPFRSPRTSSSQQIEHMPMIEESSSRSRSESRDSFNTDPGGAMQEVRELQYSLEAAKLHERSKLAALCHEAAAAITERNLQSELELPADAPLEIIEEAVRTHLKNLPARYAVSVTTNDVIHHMILMRQSEVYRDFRVHVVAVPEDSRQNMVMVTISCPDRPKIYNLITAVLDRVSSSVADADIMTSSRGIVLDRILVEAYPHYNAELLTTAISSSLNPGATPQILREIGRGLTCITYEALAANSTSIILKRPIQPSVEDVASFTREAQLMQSLPPHPNICSFITANLTQDNLYICYEYMPGGSLAQLIQSGSIYDAISIAGQVAKGMSFLHFHHVLHRDLKSTNVMLDGNGVAKICDFGISRYEAADMTAETGTYRWMAPEVIRHEKYTSAADVYSFGVLLWELIARELPFAGMTPVQAAFSVAKNHLRPNIPDHASPRLRALIARCWHKDATARPTFPEVVDLLSVL